MSEQDPALPAPDPRGKRACSDTTGYRQEGAPHRIPSMKAGAIRLKRVYEPRARQDGMRILVDRLWPRGLTSRDVSADLWLKEVAPSTALRRWYGHDLRRWVGFQRKYRRELLDQPEVLALLADLRRHATLTLLFAARDAEHSNAAILRQLLEENDSAPGASSKQRP